MPRFSASLGYLWPELHFLDRIRAAAAAGFAAVECHWPYDEDPAAIARTLEAEGLTMVSLNTPRGDASRGEFGLAAVPGREAEARKGIQLALDFGAAIGARFVHVMPGCAQGEGADGTFLDNLAHAADRAERLGIGILVEPINRADRPGYYLHRLDQARSILAALNRPVARLMFDCYHVQKTTGDATARLSAHLDVIGHVQVASVPDRGEPNAGEIDYPALFAALDAHQYGGFVGAEYRPRGGTDAGLGWLSPYRVPLRRTDHE